jgi:hypothetical protein
MTLDNLLVVGEIFNPQVIDNIKYASLMLGSTVVLSVGVYSFWGFGVRMYDKHVLGPRINYDSPKDDKILINIFRKRKR